MSIQKKKNRDLTTINAKVINMIFDTMCNIENGSITIIKQDKIVIQINTNEIIGFENQGESENFVKEAI